jgi:predicted alpha/beta-hydrolase family hydrolase
VIAAGHSYGGRQSAMLAAERPGAADGLLLLSYPLHPPDKPQQKRTDYFPSLQTPALFVHGTKDPFGSVEELREAIALIPARTDVLPVEGAAHDLKRAAGLTAEMLTRLASVMA